MSGRCNWNKISCDGDDDLNGWIGNNVRGAVTEAVGVYWENKNTKGLWTYVERKMHVTNTFFQHKGIHKYNWTTYNNAKIKVKSLVAPSKKENKWMFRHEN